ncbi:hypothetical protein MUN88_10070 [Gracilibacillus caseinilyticus]|uniref:Uncharacterized protein n=1 Tax=Gracilibacillus caseinilyticus TaxID=2932256 RepID=A0ABY4F2G5_9BACI|nr:hypothetical protein [Gracilibacillus caseinilyticus]UOQ50367.1 hypothetical protein MUN88_10070 [Gracilibacillus caseinilyticus]
MDRFDTQIKNDLNNYLQQNVHVTNENRNKINESIAKKRTPFLITGLTTVMLAITIVAMIGLPVWFQSQNNVILQQTIATISEINLTLKNKLPDDFFPVVEPEEPEKTEEQEETEQNEKQSDTEIEDNEDSPSQNKEEESEETEESPATEQETEEEAKTDAEDEQPSFENVDKAVFIGLVKKYNAMGDHLIVKQGSYKVENYQSKEEYYDFLSSFMTYETAKELWDYRLKEVEDGLEVIPMDGYERFSLEEGYIFGQYSDTEYYINRYQESDLFGGTDMTINFTLRGEAWVISDVIRK